MSTEYNIPKTNNKRIAKNTLMLYMRMMFSMLVSLYTSRVVLNMLGVEDYGIYNVVGGFVAMFSLISNSLSASTGRFLTFELGKGDMQRLKQVFSTSLTIHAILAVAVLLLAETIGIWFLNERMTIPTVRLHAANWVFQASVFAFMMGLFSVPYSASIISHEKMSFFAYLGIFDVLMRLGVVLFIAYSPWQFDRLIIYAMLLVGVSVIWQLANLVYCSRHFQECKLQFAFHSDNWKEMSSFAGWNFIGCTAGLLKDQGVNLLLNLFMGPVLNAARGVALSVNTAVGSFVGNFMAALSPQITKSYAAGEYFYMMSLVERGARFSFYILFLLALPILFETEFILTLWLNDFPLHTVNFVRLILLLSLSDVLSNTLITLQNATGKIRDYQITVGGALMLNFPVSYLCLKIGCVPESVFIVALIVSVLCLILRLLFLQRMVQLSVKQYLYNVCLNVLYVSLMAALIPTLVYFQMEEGWVRFLSIIFCCVVCSSLSIYFVGCSISERKFITDRVRVMKKRIIG